jgi:hypothetical protein
LSGCWSPKVAIPESGQFSHADRLNGWQLLVAMLLALNVCNVVEIEPGTHPTQLHLSPRTGKLPPKVNVGDDRLGGMQDWTLRFTHLIDHAACEHGGREIVIPHPID